MLPKKRKVGKELFSGVHQKSHVFSTENISLKIFFVSKSFDTRFSFVVSRKISNKANERNVLKRRGSFVIESILKDIENGFVCIFFFKKGTKNLSYMKIKKDVLFLLKKARVLRYKK